MDGIDVLRLLRAVRVGEIDRVEALRKLATDQHGQKHLEPQDWIAIRRHDRLIDQYVTRNTQHATDDGSEQ